MPYRPFAGGKSDVEFDKTTSHLIHADVDAGLEPTGVKVTCAKLWGIPVVGLSWLREFGATKAEERDRERRGRKGKGRAVEEVPADVTNAGE